jgi:hypothetical protein
MRTIKWTALASLLIATPVQAELLPAYATQCADALGITTIPGYSCSGGFENSGDGFVVGSRNNRLGKVNVGNPNVDGVFLCRNYDRATNTAGLNGYILQNTVTGNTCFFDAIGSGSATVVSPNAANAAAYWRNPANMDGDCQTCHSADPFIVTAGLAPTMNAINMISKGRTLKGAYNIVNSDVPSSHFADWNAERQIATLPCASGCHQGSNNATPTTMVNLALSQGWMTQQAYNGKTELFSASIGVWRPRTKAHFHLDLNGTRDWNSGVDLTGQFGQSGDKPFVLRGTRCELGLGWQFAELGTRRGDTWHVTRNNHYYDSEDVSARFGFGSDGAPLSWNGVPVSYQGGSFVVDYDASRSDGGDVSFAFGKPTDAPLIGRWQRGIGRRVGSFRGVNGLGYFYLDSNGSNGWDSGDVRGFQFGLATDLPFVGDFNSDAVDEIGVFRDGTWFVDLNNNFQWDGKSGGDAEWSFGEAGDIPVVSPTRWNCGTGG